MSRSSYTSVLPVEIQERIKNIDNIYKISNVKLTPVNKSYPLVSNESPRAEIYFPSDSVFTLQNAILEANIKFNHRGNVDGNSADNYTQSVYPPRYALASLIEEMNIYINGISVSSTKRYNYIYNWVKDWIENFDVEINDGLNEVKDPSILYQKPSAPAALNGSIVSRRGFPASYYVAGDDVDVNCRNKDTYHMNLGDSVGFFGEGSSKIINTAILGEVKLELVFTSQIASCILGCSVPADTPIYPNTAFNINSSLEIFNTAAGIANATIGVDGTGTTGDINRRRHLIAKNTNGFSIGDTGLATAGNTNDAYEDTATSGAVAGDANNTYEIRDIVLHIEALQFKGSDYYDTMNRLVADGLYKYHFKRYVLQTDAATATRQIDYRLLVNSECLNYVLATFRPAGYDTLANPVNTLISPTSTGHTGVYNCSWMEQVRTGLPFTFNQSKFFLRNGQKISRLGWKVDEVYLEPRNKREMYIDCLRHFRNYKNGVETKPHKGLKNIHDFENCYFTGILSFENKSDDDVKWVYNLRGLNTNGKAVAITCFTENETNTFRGQHTATNANGFSTIDLRPADAAIPTFLVCTTATLHLNGIRNIDVRF